MPRSNENGRSIGYLYFSRRRKRRRTKQHRFARGRRKPHPAGCTKLVSSHNKNSTRKLKDNRNLTFYSQNIAGLSAQSREEAINLMEDQEIHVTCLQETWTGVSPEETEFEDRHDGFLFLLKGNKKTRRAGTDVVSVSSSAPWQEVPG